MIQRADKFLAFHEFSSSRCTLVPSRDLDQSQHDFKSFKCFWCSPADCFGCSLALILPFLLPGSLVTSLPGKFTEPLLWVKVSWSWQDGYQTESTKRKLCFESGRACQSNILHSRSRKVHRKIKHRLSWLGLLVLQLKVSGSKGMEQNHLMFDLATWPFTLRCGEGVTQVLELWNSFRSARATLPCEISWVRSTSSFIVSIGYIRLCHVYWLCYELTWITRSI